MAYADGAITVVGVKRTDPSAAQLDQVGGVVTERNADFARSETVLSERTTRRQLRHSRSVAAVRIVFGLVWAVDAALKWTSHFINGYLDHLDEGSLGRPQWLQPWFRFWHNLQSPAPAAAAYFVAIVETLIAAALLLGVARKFTFVSATAFSLMIWAIPEGFGGPYTGRGADVDVSAGLIYALVFISLLFLTADGPDPYSLDAVIERHHPWWRRVAELNSDRADASPRRLPMVEAPPPDVAAGLAAESNELLGSPGTNIGAIQT